VSVSIDPQVFARLIGRTTGRDVLLFEVSPLFLDRADSNEWSEPVRFRFVRREGAFVELEFHTIDPSAVDADAL
jgi:hypothetical protein